MAGLVPAIHAFVRVKSVKTWMPGTRPGMTRNEATHSIVIPAKAGIHNGEDTR
jgi:hypothetical protein